MLESIEPRYQLPSRKHFSKTAIPALFNSTQSALASTLQEVKHFSSATDLWSSVCMQPYLSYTVHYITKDWKLQSKCLQTLFMHEDHNGENLAESLKSVLESWGVQESKQVCLTTGNGSNLVRALHLLNWLHIPCFGHNLHLAITNAIKDDSRVSRAIGVTRKLITSFSHSWKKKRDLTKVQADLGIPHHSLIIDCLASDIVYRRENSTSSAVDLTQKKGEPGKNSKKADFGIVRKQIFHRITYPKSSKILLGETYLCLI